MSRSIKWLPSFLSFFFLFSCRFSILAFLTMANRRTSTFARRRHTSASRGRRCVSSGGGWSTPGWLAPEALVGKLQRSLPRFISRLRASISTLRSIFSPALHPPLLPSSPVVVSLVRSLALSISRGSHFSFKPHTMRQMNRICETRGSGFGG